MSWEAIGALSTAVSAFVISITAIYAARQVGILNEQSRLQTDQLDHLRRATQLDGTMRIFDQMLAPDFIAAYTFVMSEFDERMADELFHEEAVGSSSDVSTHGELYVLRHMERIGTLIRNGLLDGDAILDYIGVVVRMCWQKLEGLALEQRESDRNPTLWENFEYLADEAERFYRDPPNRSATPTRPSRAAST